MRASRAIYKLRGQASGAELVRCDGNSTGSIERRWNDPIAALQWLAEEARRLQGGDRWVGYLSYDLGRWFEKVPEKAVDDLGLPLFCFSLHRGEGGEKAEGSRQKAERQTEWNQHATGSGEAVMTSNFSRPAYEAAVARAIEYIGAGDVFQVNLSQRFSVGLTAQPAEIYRRLLAQWPARYGGLLDYGDHALICNSPELFFRVTTEAEGRRRVLTRPIKGTRPMGAGMEAALRDSIKDQAELNMIVDLERNDLGRVCEIGSVKVTQAREIEAHPTVYHGVATIEGMLRNDVGFVELLRATFPGGSITGAPKIRAMEIIEELEPTQRGPYCGAIGYLAANGEMQFNVAIRTMIVKEGIVHIPVGGGIVADSNPAEEYEETLVKRKAMLEAATG